jgi:hypothetical protein
MISKINKNKNITKPPQNNKNIKLSSSFSVNLSLPLESKNKMINDSNLKMNNLNNNKEKMINKEIEYEEEVDNDKNSDMKKFEDDMMKQKGESAREKALLRKINTDNRIRYEIELRRMKVSFFYKYRTFIYLFFFFFNFNFIFFL